MSAPFKHSIGRRVTRTFVVFTLAVTMIFAGISVLSVFVAEDKVIDQLLEANADWLIETYHDSGEIGVRDSNIVDVYQPESLPDPLARVIGDKMRGEVALNEQHFHFLRLELNEQKPLILIADVSALL